MAIPQRLWVPRRAKPLSALRFAVNHNKGLTLNAPGAHEAHDFSLICEKEFSREEETVAEALALWEERERRRLEILAMLDEADASLARGEGREITHQSMKAVAEEVKQRGRRRITAERP